MVRVTLANDLRRFGHHRQFLKFCGLDLATIRSGTFRGQTKLSKYGNARLGRVLWRAGQVAIAQPANSFRDKFERCIARDRHNADLRRKAYTAIAAKMARTAHAVVKGGQPCRPFLEGTMHGGRTLPSRGRGDTAPIGGDLVDNVQAFRPAATGSRLEDGGSRHARTPCASRERPLVAPRSCLAQAEDASGSTDANTIRRPTPSIAPDTGRCR